MLELLLPERCAVCSRPGNPLCDACRGALVQLRGPLCGRCGSPGPWPVRRCAECAGRRLAFVRARSAITYDARARLFVREWKEHGRRKLAEEAAGIIAQVVARPDVDALVYVPGDPERAWERGDIAPRGLAVALGRRWDRPVVPLLRRLAAARRQRGLGLAERRRNVRGTFAATNSVTGALCLVDDVYTSGATVDACASALRRAGAVSVEVVTLARAVR
jgi:predicted amidophosphoribosyltransferase